METSLNEGPGKKLTTNLRRNKMFHFNLEKKQAEKVIMFAHRRATQARGGLQGREESGLRGGEEAEEGVVEVRVDGREGPGAAEAQCGQSGRRWVRCAGGGGGMEEEGGVRSSGGPGGAGGAGGWAGGEGGGGGRARAVAREGGGPLQFGQTSRSNGRDCRNMGRVVRPALPSTTGRPSILPGTPPVRWTHPARLDVMEQSETRHSVCGDRRKTSPASNSVKTRLQVLGFKAHETPKLGSAGGPPVGTGITRDIRPHEALGAWATARLGGQGGARRRRWCPPATEGPRAAAGPRGRGRGECGTREERTWRRVPCDGTVAGFGPVSV